MNMIKRLFNHTLLYKTYDVFYSLWEYIKDLHLVGDTFYSDNLKIVLKQYLNSDFKSDWIGRLYGVVNPNINEKGELDFSNTIIELNGDYTNNNEFIKHWTFKQLNLIGEVFKIEKLYDYINIEFKHVGPDAFDNYLIVFDIISRKELSMAFKSFVKHASIYGIIAGIILLILI